MRLFRIFAFALLIFAFDNSAFANWNETPRKTFKSSLSDLFKIGGERHRFVDLFGQVDFLSYHSNLKENLTVEIVKKPNDGGIKELIPLEYQTRFQDWKNELLATEFGRRQWESYANNKQFLLTIVVSDAPKHGAKTDDYKWTEDGELVAATITLGKNLDKGYPEPVYYPVMNSLSNSGKPYEISGNILASTKLAHEIGHVNFAAQINSKLFQRQNKLMAAYNKIFLGNGYNTKDPRLIELARELGGKPIDIWEDREYWGETNALHYLVERINKEYFYCSVFGRIKRNITDYARNYQDRFNQIVAVQQPNACQD